MIGMSENGVAVAGAVHHPIKDALYFAAKGMGSFKLSSEGLKRLQVADS